MLRRYPPTQAPSPPTPLACSQGVASAPVWDSAAATITSVVSASDFISTLTRLRHSVATGASPLSEAEMDMHTIRSVVTGVGSMLGLGADMTITSMPASAQPSTWAVARVMRQSYEGLST